MVREADYSVGQPAAGSNKFSTCRGENFGGPTGTWWRRSLFGRGHSFPAGGRGIRRPEFVPFPVRFRRDSELRVEMHHPARDSVPGVFFKIGFDR
jgi:hypothetical protein